MQVLPCLLNNQRQFNLVVKDVNFGLVQPQVLPLASCLTSCKYINAQCLVSSEGSKNKSNYYLLASFHVTHYRKTEHAVSFSPDNAMKETLWFPQITDEKLEAQKD